MKVTISLPEELVAVDAETQQRGQSRSGLIRVALRHHLSADALDERTEALESLRRSFATGDWGDETAEQLISAERSR